MLLRTGILALSAALSSASFSTCRGSAEPQPSSSGSANAPAANIELAGVDVSALTPRERREWSGYVSELLAPCADVPVSIAQCVKENRSCSRCLPAARYLVKEVREGRSKEQVSDGYKARFDSSKVKNIDLTGSPSKGPDTAPVTIVEWADFECPFCKRAYPVIDSMLDKFPGKVRLVYRVYPLSMHQHAEPAARAALAANIQGKFWEMHHKLFDTAPALETADIDKAAKAVGLDLGKLHTDEDSDAVTKKIEKDKKDAEAVGFQGTPLIYIDGREFEARGDLAAELEDWISTELSLTGNAADSKPVAAPGPSK
jgi:protein-disulfide isomerase